MMRPKLGLRSTEIIQILEKKFDDNADLLIGINDPEVAEIINVLKEAIVEIVDKNNQQIEDRFNDAVEYFMVDAFKKAGYK